MFRAKSLIHSFCNMFCLSKTIVTQLCMHPKREDHFQPLFLRRVLSALACRCWPSAWEDGDRLGHLASARGPWSPVRPHVRLPEGHRPPDNTTYGPRNIYVSVPPDTQNVLRFARNLRTYVRTKYLHGVGHTTLGLWIQPTFVWQMKPSKRRQLRRDGQCTSVCTYFYLG